MDSADSSSSSNDNNDTKILKVTESILSVCNTILSVSDLTPDEKVQVLRNITENKEAELTSTTTTSTPSTTSAATATHDDTQSGSGLAPFAGASFRDRILDGMKAYRDRILDVLQDMINVHKSRENKRLSVQITGKNGTPVYHEESFRIAERKHYDPDEIVGLDFDHDGYRGVVFPLRSLGEIEIRLGGVVVQRFNIDDLNIIFGGPYDEEDRMQYIHITPRSNGSGPIECVNADIGPLPLGWREEHAVGDDMALTDFLELVADENNDLIPQTLKFTDLVFRVKDITGTMSFVTKMSEDMGIKMR